MTRLIAFVIAATFGTACYAAPPTEESVNALLVAAKSERTLESMYTLMGQSMRRGLQLELEGKQVSDDERRVLDDMPKQFEAAMREEVGWDKMRPIFVQIYQETFTQEEVKGLTAFYKSPIGAAMIDKMPVVLQKSAAATQARMRPLMVRMNETMKKALADLKEAK